MYLIALKMLMNDRAKYFGLIFAIAFSTFLMAQQMSIFVGSMKRTASQIIDVHEADIWIMNPQIQYFEELQALPEIDLYRVRGVKGVKWAAPFFKGLGVIQYPGKILHESFLYGIDDATLIGKPKMLVGEWENLKLPNSIIIDRAGWQLIWGHEPYQLGRVIQFNDHRMVIVGIADPSAPFFSFPDCYTRYTNAIKIASQGRHNMAFILARAADGFQPEEVAQRISKQTGLQALTTDQFKWQTINYVLLNTPIPINFGITVTLGFLIGIIVSGQTFYIFILENLRQFGLLKAIGVTNKQILSMVILQAALVLFIGFGIGIGLCVLSTEIAAAYVIDLRGVFVPWQVVVGTGVAITIVMLLAVIAGIHKVLSVEPALGFKG
jgi:putative ABC transport system permease protein